MLLCESYLKHANQPHETTKKRKSMSINILKLILKLATGLDKQQNAPLLGKGHRRKKLQEGTEGCLFLYPYNVQWQRTAKSKNKDRTCYIPLAHNKIQNLSTRKVFLFCFQFEFPHLIWLDSVPTHICIHSWNNLQNKKISSVIRQCRPP